MRQLTVPDTSPLVAREAERSEEDRLVCVLFGKRVRKSSLVGHQADPNPGPTQPNPTSRWERGEEELERSSGQIRSEENGGERTFLLAPSHAGPVGLLANGQVKDRTVVGQHS